MIVAHLSETIKLDTLCLKFTKHLLYLLLYLFCKDFALIFHRHWSIVPDLKNNYFKLF